MVSLKTKNMRPKHMFLIVFGLFLVNGGVLMLFAKQLTTISLADSTAVKDSSIVAPDAVLEPDITVPQEPITNTTNDKPVITTYIVQAGDNLSTIAEKFSISTNTILWANDLNKKSIIKVGQKLTILPVSGIQYTVKKGDTLSGIAAKLDADADEIVSFNDLEDGKPIKVGMKLIIPNAELPVLSQNEKVALKTNSVSLKKDEVEVKTVTATTKQELTGEDKEENKTDEIKDSYFSFPIPGAVLTQGAHGYNAVDFGAPVGTPVLAAAEGTVIVAKSSGYNGGYGKYIVLEHSNGTQTLYGHLSAVYVEVGDTAKQLEKIALSGNTGRSTGPHLHFEVRGGINPWVGTKKGTQF